MNQQQQQQQQQQNMHMNPQQGQQPQSPISNNQMPPVLGSPSNPLVPGQHCIRNGCQNPAVVSTDWEDEYCSNECVITHCR